MVVFDDAPGEGKPEAPAAFFGRESWIEDERQLIGRAIIFHNRLRLPGHLDSETLRHCRLLRDADKVDILRVIADELRKPPAERNPVLTLGLDSGLEVREEVYQELFAKRVMGYAELSS